MLVCLYVALETCPACHPEAGVENGRRVDKIKSIMSRWYSFCSHTLLSRGAAAAESNSTQRIPFIGNIKLDLIVFPAHWRRTVSTLTSPSVCRIKQGPENCETMEGSPVEFSVQAL